VKIQFNLKVIKGSDSENIRLLSRKINRKNIWCQLETTSGRATGSLGSSHRPKTFENTVMPSRGLLRIDCDEITKLNLAPTSSSYSYIIET